MVSVEISVVSTALVGIANELGGLGESSWIMSSYLLGYVAVVIIFAKFSDIFGRKQLMILCIVIFSIFSAICGSVSSVVQLLVLAFNFCFLTTVVDC
jgi:MFS family permease